jgi:hypothetical protein
MSAFGPKRTFRIQILTWIKFRVVTHELSFNDELAFCETGACHSRALLTWGATANGQEYVAISLEQDCGSDCLQASP